jgi:hypothetical protein
MDLEQENAALKARVAELEDAIRAQKNGLANLLTIFKEYAGIFLGNYQRVMGQADAEKSAEDLVKKHFGK